MRLKLNKLSIWITVLTAVVMVASCGGGGGGGSAGGGGSGTSPPYVVSTTPSNNAASVEVVAQITATFSQPMDAASINATSFTVRNSNTQAAVPGTVSYSGTTATFTTNFLSSNSAYTATITTAATDTGGRALSSEKSWSFTTAAPVFSGFDFTFAQNDYWQLNWKQITKSSSAAGSSTSSQGGRYWIVLGAPKTIQGIQAYAVQFFGRTYSAPRWKYLAIADEQLLGSTDGTTLIPFFDARLGKWPGGGFFHTLSSTVLTVANNGTPNANDTWIAGSPAIVTGSTTDSGMCQYYPGIGTICGSSSSTSYWQQEYYRPSIGPVGEYDYGSYSDSYGSASSESDIGLTASSFTGQAYPLVSEIEPNDFSGQAQVITTANPIVGTVAPTDPGTSTTVTVIPDNSTTAVTASVPIQDWYKLVVPATGTVTITLDFENSPGADLDLYLFNALGGLTGYSIHDNVTTKTWYERISVSNVAAGTYYIGVSGFTTPNNAAATYTLDAGD